jgi:hypothetical protein
MTCKKCSIRYDSLMKRDGRTLDHNTLEEIGRMAVQRVWDGEKPCVVVASYGFSRQSSTNGCERREGKAAACVR